MVWVGEALDELDGHAFGGVFFGAFDDGGYGDFGGLGVEDSLAEDFGVGLFGAS